MKEVIKISLLGIGFSLTPEAYEILSNYIDNLENTYRNNPDGAEIISDIEARLVELILSQQSAEKVVSEELVNDIIGQIGEPSEIDDESSSRSTYTASEKFPRRLYRNPEGAKIGGVCNGLATYFNVDPTWVRIGMFLPLILLIILPSTGFHLFNGLLGSMIGAFVLLYVILWIVVPKAKTPKQKLEMVGEKVNLKNIERSAACETPAYQDPTDKPTTILGELFTLFGRLLIFGVKFVLLITGISLAVVAGVLIAAVIGFWSGANLPEIITHNSSLQIFLDNVSSIAPEHLISLGAGLALIPVAMLLYAVFCALLSAKINKAVMWIMLITWIVMAAALGGVAIDSMDSIKLPGVYTQSTWRMIDDKVDSDDTVTLIIDGDTVLVNASRKGLRKELRKHMREGNNISVEVVDSPADSGSSVTININRGQEK